ncbi:MAG TPA: 30S ribosomal protein S9 [Candidatus Paceibacterota bacterium]|jgi:small subunit ribosomal protein S9|nr:30S ribosomal protein S9 [Parcubacteria group bacterium]MDP6119679.1 30S ribosomal protein S9 [Candidatus Paceibacterota bacterium]HJN62777.1 30S ribosomal protein S9 [Candidatus Paceibacterota bacterium]|tara:strand:+ start:564 stop:977 length:414 start_codon:yes stop_codon:yes gene_type:complete
MAETKTKKKSKYFEAVGRRKNSIARVRLTPASSNSYTVNNKKFNEYFPTDELQHILAEALEKSGGKKFNINALITGGGVHAQAEAMRLGISRALVSFDSELRGELKRSGYLKRDPRIKERKKFGLKKARKSPQWSKR